MNVITFKSLWCHPVFVYLVFWCRSPCDPHRVEFIDPPAQL